MCKLSKKEAIEKWLEVNPGKTERDWLLEERCVSDEQRQILKDVFAKCGEENIQIPAIIDISPKGVQNSVEQNYLEKYPEIFGTDKEDAWMLKLGIFHGVQQTCLEFDFSLFGKFYFDLNDNQWSIDGQDTPSNLWKKCLMVKLGNFTDIDVTDAEGIASLIILDKSKLMRNTPLYSFGSPEFMDAFEKELNERKYNKENGLDKIPYKTLRPWVGEVPYDLSSDTHQLTLGEFIQKITATNICKGGRLVISFIDVKNHCLNFPDEAVGNITTNGIYSGYYEEMSVVYPERIDFKRMLEKCDLSQPLVADTKLHGKIPVMDVVPFEYDGRYAFTAIVVDAVVNNGRLSKVRDWLSKDCDSDNI